MSLESVELAKVPSQSTLIMIFFDGINDNKITISSNGVVHSGFKKIVFLYLDVYQTYPKR